MSTLVFPLVPWSFYIAVTCYFLFIVLYLHTSGKPVYKTILPAMLTTCMCENGVVVVSESQVVAMLGIRCPGYLH